MQDINVVVTFCSQTGATERLALKAALGAVQARANIRLRWLREAVEDAVVDRVPEWRENRDRMSQEYVAPREADFLWADAVVLAVPARAFSTELSAHIEHLRRLSAAGKFHAKVGTAITAGEDDPRLAVLYSALAGLDLVVVPKGRAPTTDDTELALRQGRRATAVARALKLG